MSSSTLIALIPIVFMLIALILPVAYLLASFTLNLGVGLAYLYVKIPPDGELYRVYDIGGYKVIALTGYDFGPLLNTLILALIVSITTTALALVTAVTCLSLSGASRLLLGYIAPLIASLPAPLVSAYAVIHLFHRDNGLVNIVLASLLNLRVSLEGIAGVAVYQVISFHPLAHLIILSYMESIDRSVVESAYNLGGRGLNVILRILIPLSKPAIVIALSLTFILSAEDLSGPIAFSRYNSARNLLSYIAYHDFISEFGYTVSVRAVTYVVILSVIAITSLLIAWRYLRTHLYPLVSPTRIKVELGVYKLPLLIITITLMTFSLMPTIMVLGYSMTDNWFGFKTPDSVTMGNYLKVISNPYYARALLNTVFYTILAVILVLVLAYIASYVSVRANSRLSPIVEVLTVIPLVIPGIAIGIGYFTLFHTLFKRVDLLDPMINPSTYLILAYASRRLTYASRPVIASMQKIPVSLEEQAFNLGAGITGVLRTIMIPLTLNPMIVGVLLASMHMATEFSVSIVLTGAHGVSASHPAPVTPVILGMLTYNPLSIHVASALLITTLLASIIASIITALLVTWVTSGLSLRSLVLLLRGV